MQIDLSRYRVKLAETEEERPARSACATGFSSRRWARVATPEERAARREWDAFDPYFDHLILVDHDPRIADPLDRVVGVYRLMRRRGGAGGAWASTAPRSTISSRSRRRPRDSVELGRSCVAPEPSRRAGDASAVERARRICADRGIEILFGVASFPGTDPEPLAEALSYLHHAPSRAARPAGAGAGRAVLAMDRMPPRRSTRPARCRRSRR